MKKIKKRWIILGVIVMFFVAVYLCNASWWAPESTGRAVLIARRGVAQVYDRKAVNDSSCVAQLIPPPTHDFIANTFPYRWAAAAG